MHFLIHNCWCKDSGKSAISIPIYIYLFSHWVIGTLPIHRVSLLTYLFPWHKHVLICYPIARPNIMYSCFSKPYHKTDIFSIRISKLFVICWSSLGLAPLLWISKKHCSIYMIKCYTFGSHLKLSIFSSINF